MPASQRLNSQSMRSESVADIRSSSRLTAANAAPKVGSPLANHAMVRLLSARAIQAKLRINSSVDEFEREADRVADQVMRMPNAVTTDPLRIQRACAHCKKDLDQNRIHRLCS